MNKTELVTAMAEKTGTSKENCDKALNAFIDIVKDTLAEKEKVNIIGFGSFRKNGYYCLGFFANVQRFETSPTLPLHAPFFDAFRSFVASPLSYSGAPT